MMNPRNTLHWSDVPIGIAFIVCAVAGVIIIADRLLRIATWFIIHLTHA